jgi:thymidylate synthase (FAD)
MGIPKGSARYVLPAACETRIVVSINARSLFNLLAQRECGAEDWEFFTVATRMHQELLKVAPRIFQFAGPRCKTERKCPEGEVGDACGRYRAFGATVGLREGELQRA